MNTRTALAELVAALDGAFISSWQSTAAWQLQLDAAREALAHDSSASTAALPDAGKQIGAQPEPVAWLLRPKVQRHPDRPMVRGLCYGPRSREDFEIAESDGDEYVPLYAAPPPAAQPALTDERIYRMWTTGWDSPQALNFARAVIAADRALKGQP